MKAYKNFLKEVKKLDIKVVEYFYLDGFGWIKAKDLDNVPKNVKKTFYWELGTLNESRLKEVQSDAVSELALLDNDQLERQLKRLDLLNEFETFHNFIKGFYVKAVDNTYNGLDISDFKLLLEQCFYVKIPDKGNINVEFLTELINQVYFKSSLLDGLKNQTTNLLPLQPIDIIQNRTKQVIAEAFKNMDKKGWQYAFATEQDYNLFTDLLTNFFEYKDYSLPESTIQLKRNCKTKVGKVLGGIHKEVSNEDQLSTDFEFFQIIRVLSHFEKETEGDLYKALTR